MGHGNGSRLGFFSSFNHLKIALVLVGSCLVTHVVIKEKKATLTFCTACIMDLVTIVTEHCPSESMIISLFRSSILRF